MDRSQQTNSTRDSLAKIREETRQTRSLDVLRHRFEELREMRRQSLDDFDLQVLIADIHQEIIDRASRLTREERTPDAYGDHSVIFQPPVAAKTKEAAPQVEAPSAIPYASQEEHTEVAQIPPGITRVDPKSWQMILGLAAFFCAVVLVGVFYLIQTARELNIPAETRSTKADQAAKSKPDATVPAPLSPALRLYTDLAAGTITFDNQPPRNLVDGEFMLDNLPPGQHSVRVTGTSGSASFQFEVTGRNAPKVTEVPQATNALAVLVSQQDGQGQLVTSGGRAQILLDGKSAGEANLGGLELVGLGAVDHDLQVIHENDRQRFVMTYTPAPVLTVYVKSDSNSGILQIATGEDGVDVYIDNVLFRRKTDHGQVRVSIRAGKYKVRVHKDGFIDPPVATVEIKKAEVANEAFVLLPINANVAGLRIKGALAGTTAYIDHEFATAIGPDGGARISNIKPGDHVIELRHELAVAKKLQRTFRAGEIVTLSGPDVTLEKSALEVKPPTPAVVPPQDNPKPAGSAPNEGSPERSQVQKGGGFVSYDTPKSTGHYSFRTQGHVGGVLKKGKLQWYAGYQDSHNYILFVLDGKHCDVKEMRNGKAILWNRTNCSVDSSTWVQVDLTVKPGSVSSRIKTGGEGWLDMGSVASFGRDFTQDKVGFYIPPNDEVAVANFKFANR